VNKNLSLLRVLGIEATRVEFPLARAKSTAVAAVRAAAGPGEFALINPGAAWPNKRWPAERFGELAAVLREVRGMVPVVLWGPGEQEIARQVVSASSGAAIEAPPTGLSDILELAREASLIVSGDTGPLHLAAAVQTPVVAIMGPSNPQRNGPWAPGDVTVSRFEACGCHYERRCRREDWCLADVSVAEMTAAVQRRLATRSAVDSRDATRMHLDSRGSDVGNASRGGTSETDATEK
jgi:heptosyltransferase-1